MLAISSLNDWFGCNFFCTSAFLDGQPYSAWSDRIPRCSSTRVTILISSVVMQSGVAVHDIDGYGHTRYFFISVCPWLCLDSQSAMNSYSPGLYSILILYWWICNSILYSLCDRLAKYFLKKPVACGQLSCWLHGQSSSSDFFLCYGVCIGFLFLCCYIRFLHLSGSCSWMLLATVLHCQVLCSLETTCHPSLVEDLLLHQNPTHCF